MAIILVQGNSLQAKRLVGKPRPVPPIEKGVVGPLFPRVDDLPGDAEGGR